MRLVSKSLYHPRGTTRYTNGTTPTDYAYTGQMREGDIYYYGARWQKVLETQWSGIDPAIGRFLQADTIVPVASQGTQAFDRYAYVNNNPLNYTNPSGHAIINTLLTDSGGGGMLETMQYFFNWSLNGAGWDHQKTYTVYSTGMTMAFSLGKFSDVQSLIGPVTFYIRDMKPAGTTYYDQVVLNAGGFTNWTVAHELGHVLDFNYNMNLSKGLEQFTGGMTDAIQGAAFRNGQTDCTDSYGPGCNNAGYYYGGIPPKGSDRNFNRKEDFAESFAAVFYANVAEGYVRRYDRTELDGLYYSSYSQTTRGIWTYVLIEFLVKDFN